MHQRIVSIDLENYDPNLENLGNGAIRKDGNVLVAGLYDGQRYYPCIPGEPSWQRLVDVATDSSIIKVAHNGIYDYDWIQNGVGINLKGNLEDTMTRAGLLDEYAARYTLDACCYREGITGKNAEDSIEAWWRDSGAQGDVMQNLMFVPRDVLLKYNEQDCIATYELYQRQQPKLESEGLLEVNQLEMDIMYFVLEMRKNGIRIDVNMIDKLREQTEREVADGMNALFSKYGINSLTKRKGPGTVLWAVEQLGLVNELSSTSSGELSMSTESLLGLSHPVAQEILSLKRKQTLLTKYLNSAFTKFCIGDRIHGTFKPTLRDEGGALTGRFASSDPNMQNFSARESKGGDLVRGVFIGDEGCLLGTSDYSQVEYKVLAHYAVGPGSTALRDNFRHGADYHELVRSMLGWNFPDGRRLAKTFNFGMMYGMGLSRFKQNFKLEAKKAAAERGMTTDEYATHHYNDYMKRMTFLRPTMQAIQAQTMQHGFVRSLSGRKHRTPPVGVDGNIPWYKMTNYMIQGSAADVNKMGLRDCMKAGIFNEITAHITVHDEVVYSIPEGSKTAFEAVRELEHLMCECVKLRVPIEIDTGIGSNWFEAGEHGGELWNQLKEQYGIV